MASLTPTPKQQIYGSDGNPLVGGKIYTYAAGTTTPLATYTDAGAGTANTNPIILNSLGQANIWLAPSSSYKFSVYTSADVLLYTVDNITAPIDYLSLVTSLASPPPIGSTAPNTGAFTTLSSTGALTVGGTAAITGDTTITGKVTTATGYQFADSSYQSTAAEPAIKPVTSTVAANALTLSLDPCTLVFRSATLGSGAVSSIKVATAVSVTVPSSATLGTISGQQARLVIVALNNAGTVELAVVNMAGGTNLDECGLISTTAISAGSSSSAVVYSTTARTNVAYRVVGFVDITEATAGTWATAATTIQGQGGQAITSMSTFGNGQTYQAGVLGNGTIYYNTTSKPIMYQVVATNNGAGAASLTINIDGETGFQAVSFYNLTAGAFQSGCFVVQPFRKFTSSYSSLASVTVAVMK